MSVDGRVSPRLGVAVGVYPHPLRLRGDLHHTPRRRRFHHL